MTCRAVGHEFYVSKSTIYHISEKDEEICQYVHEVALESSNVHDEPMEKTKNLLNCGWWHKTTTIENGRVDSIVVRLKAKGIYGHVTQCQENFILFLFDVLLLWKNTAYN